MERMVWAGRVHSISNDSFNMQIGKDVKTGASIYKITALGQQMFPQKPSRGVAEIEQNRIIWVKIYVWTLLLGDVRSKADMLMNNINEVVVVKEDLNMKNRMDVLYFLIIL